MFILSVKLLPKQEETVTLDSSSKGSSVQTKKIDFFLRSIKYVIYAELLHVP